MGKQKLMQFVKKGVLSAICFFCAAILNAQNVKISGTVIDDLSEPVIGANVTVKGTTNGTITDLNGQFILDVSGDNSVLVISSIGYTKQEVKVGSQRVFNISLKEDLQLLDEVVVVGYGVQKKVNLTGAVGAVSSEELNSRIAPSTTSLLQGRTPGLQITQNSAMPGNEDVEMRIRGMGTFSTAGNNPLVLIDGVEGDMNKLNPNMIESISVLKDAASAAIYGSRAANGVILVTTKAGSEGRLNIDYNFNYSVQKPTEPMNRITNSVEYMRLVNKAIDFSGNVNTGWRYTDEEIDRYVRGQDPNDPSYNPAQYPNCDWLGYLVRDAPIRQHFLSVNGGKGGTTFNVGLGYLNQTGLLLGTDYERYDVQVNFKSSLTSRVTFGTNINMNYGIRHDTSFNDSDMDNMNASRDQMRSAYAASPLMTPQLPDGSGRWSSYAYESKGGNKNPIANAVAGGGQLNDNNYLLGSAFMNVKIIEGLNAEIKGAIKYTENQNKIMNATWDGAVFLPDENGVYENRPSTSAQSFRQRNNRSKQYTLFGTLNYTKTFNDAHYVNVMAGYSQESYKYEQIEGYRTGYTTTDMWYLKAGPTPSQTNDSEVKEWALQSVFGRINYDYKGKYLFEANVRYDGTSRLPKDGRWGTFPSVSAGWRISEEDFMESISYLDNMKVRASWGQLGNQNIGNYPYQSMLENANYNFGGTMTAGYYSKSMTNDKIKWETTTSTNVGLDFGFLKNKIYGSVDWYRKYTKDILRTLQVPNFVGVSGPTVNQGEMKNVGWDFTLGHNNTIGDVRYSISANLDTYKNTLVKYGADEIDGVNIRREGLPWNTYYVLIQNGVYQNQAEIDNENIDRKYAGAVVIKPGDIRYKDVGSRGPDGNPISVPDGVIDATYDRAVVSGAFPKFNYGFNLNVSYKIFDLSCFFQGVQGRKLYVSSWGISPFNQGSPPPTFWRDAWDGEGTSNFIPHIYMDGYGPMASSYSSFFLRDASYLRMKSLQVGVSLPKSIAGRFLLQDARIYFSGDNLLTFTKFFDGQIDPERTTQGSSDALYPQAKIFTFGLKITL
ncbi:MAG: TonB-dependent receptor [Tannerella sp.]|jgi:TonB-linked SusC/RagA family outer membrane protein|nr:TonB-dependent receptor [Tannerella sp.]